MKKLYACFLLICLAVSLPAQVNFQKTYGIGSGRSVQVTSDHGFIMAGFAEGSTKGVMLVKTDSLGVLQWARFYYLNSAELYGYSVRQTYDGGYVITGTVYVSNNDVLLLKVSSNGTLQWKKFFNIGAADYGLSVEQTRDSGFVIAGYSGSDMILIRTAGDGSLLWSKTIGLAYVHQAKCVKQTSDDGFIIAGFTSGFGAGAQDMYLVKTDANGNLQWTKTYGGIDSDFGNSVVQTADHGYAVAGTTISYGAGISDVYLVKTDSLGNLQWTKTFGGSFIDEGNDLQLTGDGGLIITGRTNSYGLGGYDAYLVKTDSAGALQWSRTFGGLDDETGYAVTQTSDDGFIIAGDTYSSGPMMYLVRTSATGIGECAVTAPVSNAGSGGVQSTGGTDSSSVTTTGNLMATTDFAGVQATICTGVGMEPVLQGSAISVFPNPFSSETTLRTERVCSNATLVVFNSSGQQVMEVENVSGNTIVLSRGNLADGLYFFQLSENDKIIATGKLILTEN